MFLRMSSLTFLTWTLCACGDVVFSNHGWCGLIGKRIVQGFSINEGKKLVCSVGLKTMSIFPQSQCWELSEMRLSWCDSVALPWRGRRLGQTTWHSQELALFEPEFLFCWGLRSAVFLIFASLCEAASCASEGHIYRAPSLEMPWY